MEHDKAIVAEHTLRICTMEKFVADTKTQFFGVVVVIILQIISFAYMWGQLCQIVKAQGLTIERNTRVIDEKLVPHLYSDMEKIQQLGIEK